MSDVADVGASGATKEEVGMGAEEGASEGAAGATEGE